MIKEGETVKKPGIRRKPVTAVLPPDITVDQMTEEMQRLLLKDNEFDVKSRADECPWAKRI